MPRKMFVNLPIKDLQKTTEFFSSLGFCFNAQFSDDRAACMVVNDDCYVMLLVEDFFASFTGKELCDATRYTEAILSLSADSRDDATPSSTRRWQQGPHRPPARSTRPSCTAAASATSTVTSGRSSG